MSVVLNKSYDLPEFNKKEILRYSGVQGEIKSVNELLDECLSEITDKLVFNVCYTEFIINIEKSYIDLGFMQTTSNDLKKNLDNCNKIIVFAATIGVGIDRLISKYTRVSPSKAHMLQAIGAERIETLCNVFNDEIKCKYPQTSPRFSPGYGDFPLDTQKDIFAVLDCPKRLGLTLNNSMLMSPSKSVTAIIGIRR